MTSTKKTKPQEHTPAPWYRSGSDCRVVLGPSCSYKNGRIADVGAGVPWSDEVDANARLISAAPDLLAALKTVRDRYAGITFAEIDGENRRVLDAVLAAIAKATGQEGR